MRPTAGHPMVVATIKAPRPDVPHLLFYGHYDVQPADPLDLWQTPPFEPRLADGAGRQAARRPRHRGRQGPADDLRIEACRAFKETGELPCHMSPCCSKARRRAGSPSLPAFLAENAKAELRADMALVCDTLMWDAKTPAITTMLRGLVL